MADAVIVSPLACSPGLREAGAAGRMGVHSCWNAFSTLRREARLAGRIAASMPARSATTTKAASDPYRVFRDSPGCSGTVPGTVPEIPYRVFRDSPFITRHAAGFAVSRHVFPFRAMERLRTRQRRSMRRCSSSLLSMIFPRGLASSPTRRSRRTRRGPMTSAAVTTNDHQTPSQRWARAIAIPNPNPIVISTNAVTTHLTLVTAIGSESTARRVPAS